MSINLPNKYNGIVYQIIRPTGLLDPVVEVRPSLPESFENLKSDLINKGFGDMPVCALQDWSNPQIPDLILEIEKTVKLKQRVLVTTLTKRMAEELSDYLVEKGIKSKYLHSDIDTVERVEILRDLRKGVYDVLVGINLLREGLDLPEVSLVAILDADKEGFLRSKTSLIQVMGRAARHIDGRVIMYADKVTDSMKFALEETRNRRLVQEQYNKDNNITPKTISKEIKDQLDKFKEDDSFEDKTKDFSKKAQIYKTMPKSERSKFVKELKMQMELYADMLEFEKAAEIRDILDELK